ncbi:MAG: hypothetical protein J0H18_06570 [Rhizobiales bacterium]|nr:hypothetical protein [Hyphomicrobiales bacterium]OJY04803.1 MAG: hypothetical protein BGP07_08810 [Rhizobiales bacterium 63-22]
MSDRQPLQWFAGFSNACTQKQILRMTHYRPFAPGENVHPGRVFCLDPERRICTILVATIGYAVIDDDDLAIFAQIDSPKGQVPKTGNVVQRCNERHARFAQLSPALSADEGA